jgi:O-antigen/teichoic acid export membrane protein
MGKRIKDFLLLGFGRGIIALTSVLYIRVFTTLLSPGEVGRMNIILTVSGWFGLVLLNPVGMYMNRRLLEWGKEGALLASLKNWLLYLLAVSALSVLLLPAYSGFLGIEVHPLWLAALVVAGIVVTTGNNSCAGFLNLLGHRFYFISGSVLTLWAGLAFSALLAISFPASAELWLGGQLAGQALAFLLMLRLLHKVLPAADLPAEKRPFLSDAGPVWNFSWPLSVSVFLYWIHTQGYRFLFQREAGSDALGIFVVGFAIGSSLMLAFESLFSQFYQPIYYAEISHSSDEGKTAAWDRYAEAFIPMVIITAVFVAANGGAIARILAAEKFRRGGEIIIWGAAAEGLRMIISLISLVSHSKFKMAPIILPGAAGTLTLLCGLVFLMPMDHFIGAGTSIVLGWIVAGILLYYSMRRLLPIKLPWARIAYAALLSVPLAAGRLALELTGRGEVSDWAFVSLALSTFLLFLAYAVLLHKWLPPNFRAELLEKVRHKKKVLSESLSEMFPFR